ncbi:MAG: hypothetical protein PHF21_02230 [Bacilli bacterium]|nr:hypothetical protein [Bacilli bacterium]
MKDATGELSMTAIAVVAIAAIGVVFTTLIWPSIKANITRSTYCTQAHRCDDAGPTATEQTCYYYDKDDNEQSVKCPTK